MNAVFGFKPSRGMTPNGTSTTVGHAVTRTVRDSAALLDAILGPERGAMFFCPPPARPYLDEVTQSPGKLKIALLTGYDGFVTHPDCVAAALDAAKLCEDLGHTVELVKPPVDLVEVGRQFLVLFQTLTAGLLDQTARRLGRAVERTDVEIGKWLAAEAGRKIDALTYAKADAGIAAATAAMSQFFLDYDVLLSPTIGRPPVEIGVLNAAKVARDSLQILIETYGTFTVLANFAGIPSMSVPLHWAKGIPIGTMFQSAIARDALLLRLAGQLERARPWAKKRPPFK
jgi:amidase